MELTRMTCWSNNSKLDGFEPVFGYGGVIRTVGMTVAESIDMELPTLPQGWEWGKFMRMRDVKDSPDQKVTFWRSDEIIHFECFCSKEVWDHREGNCPVTRLKKAADDHVLQHGKLKGSNMLSKMINLYDRNWS